MLGAVGDGVAAGVTEIARDFYFPRDQDIDTAPEDDLGLDLDGDSHEVQERGFLTPVGCHTWRATGVTVYLENGGRLEHAQQMAAHESPRTTKLYDRTKDEITIGEVERIQL